LLTPSKLEEVLGRYCWDWLCLVLGKEGFKRQRRGPNLKSSKARKEMDIKECFEQLVWNKAKHMADTEQATNLGLKSDDELKGFKFGGWDAMIFDMAQSLNLVTYARRDFRRHLIEKWQEEGL